MIDALLPGPPQEHLEAPDPSPGRTICGSRITGHSSPSPILWSRLHDDRDLHGIRPHPLSTSRCGRAPDAFHGMISCPPESPGLPESPATSRRRLGGSMRGLSIRKRDLPHGRLVDRFIPHCTGQVSSCGCENSRVVPGFPIRPDELRTQPVIMKRCSNVRRPHRTRGQVSCAGVIDGAVRADTGPNHLPGDP